MAEVTHERLGQLVRGLFSVLLEHAEGLQAADAIRKTEEIVHATPFEDSFYPKRPKDRRYDKILRFATIRPAKAGWMIKRDGIWSVTPDGKKAYETISDPRNFYSRARDLYAEWRGAQDDADEPSLSGPANRTSAFEEAQETAVSDIRSFLQNMPVYQFQNLVAALLRTMGYYITWTSPPGADGGIDIIAHRDPLGTTEPRIKVQVKRQQSAVTVETMRSFIGLLGERDVGIFVATGGFTKDAASEARRHFAKIVSLIDFERLFTLWREHYSELPENDREMLPLRPVYFLAPAE